MKLKADAFKLYANGFLLIDFVKVKERMFMPNIFKEFSAQRGEKNRRDVDCTLKRSVCMTARRVIKKE